jgi:hypothetical protein
MLSGGEEEPPGRLRRGTATRTVFQIFGDESCTTSAEYRVQGALWVPKQFMKLVRAELERVRGSYRTGGGRGEIKWHKIRGKRLKPRAVGLVDVFFDSPVAACMRFNSLIVPLKNDPALSRGQCELGVNKTWWVLLNNRLEPDSHNLIQLDERGGRTQADEETLKRVLNRTSGNTRYTVGLCRSVQSQSDDLIQLADLLVGATGWDWNGRRTTDTAKAELHRHICERLGCTTLRRETKRHPKFDLWLYRPSPQQAVSA